MAIAVSQAYKDVQARRGGKTARVVVQYKRRYFDTGAVAFAYEPNWHTLAQRDFLDPGEIVNQLDVAEPSIFKSSTVTLRPNNTRNQWVRSVNDPSVFAADALAPNGYYDDQTLFQILYSFLLPDGTWGDCAQFTGFAADYTPLPRTGEMQILVSASLLAEKCAAVKVNTTVTGEAVANSVVNEPLNPSPGDGTTAVLKTTSTGVIKVVNVKANGVALTLTTDYSVSIPTDGTAAAITLVSPAAQNGKVLTATLITKNLLTASQAVTLIKTVYADGVALAQGGDYTYALPTSLVGPAQITLVDPTLWIGKAFTWDGAKGQLTKKVEEAVALYCDASGIGSGSRNIQPVIFPGGLSSSKTVDTESDWEAGTLLQNLTTTLTPGSIFKKWFLIDDFSDGDYTANPPWTVAANNGSVSIVSSALQLTATNLLTSVYTASQFTLGTFRYRFKGVGSVYFMADSNANSGGNPTGNWYRLTIDNVAGTVSFVRPFFTIATASGLSLGSGFNEFRVTRDAGGNFNVFLNGTQIISAADSTYSASSYMFVVCPWNGAGTVTAAITDIYTSSELDGIGAVSGSATIAELVFNLLATPAALGMLDHFEVLNGGAVVYKTASAPDSAGSPGTWDALQVLGAGNQMASTPRQWLKLRVEINPGTGLYVSPEVQKLVAHFTSSTVTLSQVAPTSGTAWDKIQVYARMCNYETGWDASGVFFFRSRTVSGAAVLALDPWTNVIHVDDTHPGWDRVFNIGHASQPPYEYYYTKTDAGEAEPTSERRFGPIQRDLDFSGELVANDAQIGKAAAQTAYQDNYRPRWRCRAQTKLAPWLELSDPVTLTFVPDRKLLESIAGDPLQASGFAGAQGVALAVNKKMKIVGITKKLAAATADLLLEEILS